MSDQTAGQLPANQEGYAPLEPAPPSTVAPSGGAGQGLEAEQQAGKRDAERNAKKQEEALQNRQNATLDARTIASQRAAIGEKDYADKAEKVRSMVEDLPPAGPGLPKVDKAVIAATMDPNNPVLNPDMSEIGRNRGLPPGAHVPEPVLPGDSVETQFATKALTDAHAEEAEEVAKGLPEPIYPPAGSQPQIELTQEEREQMDREGGRHPRIQDQRPQGQQPQTQPQPGFVDPALAQPYPPPGPPQR